jgi:hypothetical protein
MKTKLCQCLVMFAAIFLLLGQLPVVAAEPKKASLEAPTDKTVLAGRYHRGDGTGYNVTITLSDASSYTSEWHGCLGKYGEACGTWKLRGRKIRFTPTKEKGMMKGYLTTLEVTKFAEAWILVPMQKEDRDFYEKWGVSQFSCFHKQ